MNTFTHSPATKKFLQLIVFKPKQLITADSYTRWLLSNLLLPAVRRSIANVGFIFYFEFLL